MKYQKYCPKLLIVLTPSLAGVMSLAALLGYNRTQGARSDLQAQPDQVTQARLSAAYGKLPLSFEANHGQTDSQVRFLSRGPGYSLFLTPTEAVLHLQKAEAGMRNQRGALGEAVTNPQSAIRNPQSAVLQMKLVGANLAPDVAGLEELPGRSNYFFGSDPKKWRTNVPTYAKVRYEEVYPGVDLIYYGNQRRLEYDFVVAAGVDPRVIRLGFEGADKVEVDAEGDLLLQTAGEQVRMRRPVIYQEIEGARKEVFGGYVIGDERQISFEVGAYDLSRPLVSSRSTRADRDRPPQLTHSLARSSPSPPSGPMASRTSSRFSGRDWARTRPMLTEMSARV